MARSRGPVRPSVSLRGMVMRTLCWRQWRLILRLLYALSPATRFGRIFGRPRPARLTAPPSMSDSKTVASLRCPGVSTIIMSLPPPSARRCTLVLNPPWLRPKASVFGSPLLPQPRADGPGRWCRLHSGSPNLYGPQHRPVLAPWQRGGPRCQPYASGRSGWQQSARNHSAPADLAREPLCAGPTESRSGSVGGRRWVVQYSVFGAVGAAEAVPTARLSILLGSYPRSIPLVPTLFANTP